MCDDEDNPEQAAVALGRVDEVANALRSHELQRDDLDSLFGIVTLDPSAGNGSVSLTVPVDAMKRVPPNVKRRLTKCVARYGVVTFFEICRATWLDPRHVAPQHHDANAKLFDLTGNSSVGTLPYPEVILRRRIAVQAMNAGVGDSFTMCGGEMA
jgi:hypothetical protein